MAAKGARRGGGGSGFGARGTSPVQNDLLIRVAGRWALAIVIGLMVLVPAFDILLTGRDLGTFASLEVMTPSALSLRMLQAASLSSVLLLLFILVTRGVLNFSHPRSQVSVVMIWAFCFYAVTNLFSPGLLGHIPGIERSLYYIVLLFLAVYALGDDAADTLIRSARNALCVLFLLSIVCSVLFPTLTLRFYNEELRLPLVPFRFWGLSSGPNSIAPLSLVLILLAWSMPFARRWLQVLTMCVAGFVLLTAQSQTTWLAAFVILPLFALYRHDVRRYGYFRWRLSAGMVILAAGLVLAGGVFVFSALMREAPSLVAPTGGLPEGMTDIVTGRSYIWAIAIDTFLKYPMFGYGLTAWGPEFRAAIDMSFASHAHNQLMQALSVGGLTALVGLVVYLLAFVFVSRRVAAATGGLGPALVGLMLIRCLSEVPLPLGNLLVHETFMHVLTFAVLATASARSAIAISQWQPSSDDDSDVYDARSSTGRGRRRIRRRS
ncbi:MAG: O-antigen ligase family protein [Hyphomicrobiaceae bacterium]